MYLQYVYKMCLLPTDSSNSDDTTPASLIETSVRRSQINSLSEPSQTRKRKAKSDVSTLLESFLDVQKQQFETFMQVEEQRNQQEQLTMQDWMKGQMALQQQQLQAQREERREHTQLILQVMNRMFMSTSPQFTAPLQPTHSYYEDPSASHSSTSSSSPTYHNL